VASCYAEQLEFVPSGPIELSLTQGYWTESLDQLPFLKSSDFVKKKVHWTAQKTPRRQDALQIWYHALLKQDLAPKS
jgi:hypothetical protein